MRRTIDSDGVEEDTLMMPPHVELSATEALVEALQALVQNPGYRDVQKANPFPSKLKMSGSMPIEIANFIERERSYREKAKSVSIGAY